MPNASVKSPRLRKLLREAAIFIAVAIASLSARSSLADHYRIPTGSMEPTVHVGDRVVVLKAAYDLRLPFSDVVLAAFDPPERGDVVVLDSPEQDMLLLKRVVAIAGDRVAIREGEVWIDDERYAIAMAGGEVIEFLGERHELSMDRGGGPDLAETIVPAGHYLVLGDHRGDSRDGRSFGMIPRSAIRGRAVAVYFSEGALQWRGL